MDLEMITLNKSEKDKYYSTYMQKLNYDMSEHVYETDSQTESRLVVAEGEGGLGRGGLGVRGSQKPAVTYRMDKQQGPTIYG